MIKPTQSSILIYTYMHIHPIYLHLQCACNLANEASSFLTSMDSFIYFCQSFYPLLIKSNNPKETNKHIRKTLTAKYSTSLSNRSANLLISFPLLDASIVRQGAVKAKAARAAATAASTSA